MKKSQFITIFIMLVVASVLICTGCFLEGPKVFSGNSGGSGDITMINTPAPTKDREPQEEPTVNPGETAVPTEEPTPTPVQTPTPTPDQSTPEPTFPAIAFPQIQNVSYMGYDSSCDYFNTYWKTGEDNQNSAVIKDSTLKRIKAVEGYYVFYEKGNNDEWVHRMTFSLSTETGYTGKILDLLARYGIKATFFVTKEYIAGNPDLVRRMKNEGHLIGNRGIVNTSVIKTLTPETFAEGLLAVEQEYQKLFGATERMYLFRPEYFSERLLVTAKDMGYTVVFRTYTYYSEDTKPFIAKGPEALADWFSERGGYNGSVSELVSNKDCYEALEYFIPHAQQQGISFRLIQRKQ